MNEYKRAKLNKVLIIIAIVLVVISIVLIVSYSMIAKNRNKEKLNYDDSIIGKNYYVDITINTESKEIKRDGKETTLNEEFDIGELKEEELLNSTGDLINFFEDSTIEVEMQNSIIHLKNLYQTKTLLVEAEEIEGG